MNYGLWDDTVNDLVEANKNLTNFVLKKSEMTDKTNLNILDVGCGYGEQDIEWLKQLDKSCKITAVDISEEQIYNAMKKNSNVNFDICDAAYIGLKYKNNSFDRVVSLESAFHYPERNVFFKNVNSLLKDNGKFIITDIMLNKSHNENLITKIFLYIFADILCIPKQNLITATEWDKQLSSELNIEESIDITEQTFNPYYMHFMTNYCKNSNWPDWVGNALSTFFCSNQPFIYKVVTCTKKI
jgi:erythromycin 3''-O-methyltransferase